ncbi:MAG: hypothetical protein E7349_05355 [Clostridiales bacterium]|nr:hypothetical protein [Clostridiales bacterium]
MQGSENCSLQEREKERLKKLLKLEDLAEKKSKIYARLLTDMGLAEEMSALSLRHEKRKEALTELAFGKVKKKRKDGGMSEMNGEKE